MTPLYGVVARYRAAVSQASGQRKWSVEHIASGITPWVISASMRVRRVGGG